MDKTVRYADEKIMSFLKEKASSMKYNVIHSISEYKAANNGRIYYFSPNGSDENTGLCPDSALRTLDKLASLPLIDGDVVLFERGGIFRGNITAHNGVTYSAYGNGNKPVICASRMNYANEALWKKTEKENVWVCTEKVENAGIVLLDHDGAIGKYDVRTAINKYIGVGGFSGTDDLAEDTAVWNDLESKAFYFYSTDGNPGKRFSSIEIGECRNAITAGNFEKKIESRNVTIDNLHITLSGAHGVGALDSVNLTVRNCIFDWIGGGVLFKDVRYGNAVEMYGNCHGYHVYNNWIYQIYDTGITHQQSEDTSKKSNVMSDVCYHDNLIEYCYWSIEYYNAVVPDAYRETSDVHVYDNYCRMGGYGWGCKGRENSAPMYALSRTPQKTQNYVTENNIFERCLGAIVTGNDSDFSGLYTFRHNTYLQPYGANIARFRKTVLKFDENVFDVLENNFHEEDPEVWFLSE